MVAGGLLCPSLTGSPSQEPAIFFMPRLTINNDGDLDDGEGLFEIPPDVERVLLGLKDHLRTTYEPVTDPAQAELHYSTIEIHRQLLKHYPNELFLTRTLVATWLDELGFHFYDYGEISLEWMMKKR